MGKTVIMQALAREFDTAPNAVVLFDCFGDPGCIVFDSVASLCDGS
jgi:hypothetical protein